MMMIIINNNRGARRRRRRVQQLHRSWGNNMKNTRWLQKDANKPQQPKNQRRNRINEDIERWQREEPKKIGEQMALSQPIHDEARLHNESRKKKNNNNYVAEEHPMTRKQLKILMCQEETFYKLSFKLLRRTSIKKPNGKEQTRGRNQGRGPERQVISQRRKDVM